MRHHWSFELHADRSLKQGEAEDGEHMSCLLKFLVARAGERRPPARARPPNSQALQAGACGGRGGPCPPVGSPAAHSPAGHSRTRLAPKTGQAEKGGERSGIFAIGGRVDPAVDGDPAGTAGEAALVAAAVRHCRAQTRLDLSACTQVRASVCGRGHLASPAALRTCSCSGSSGGCEGPARDAWCFGTGLLCQCCPVGPARLQPAREAFCHTQPALRCRPPLNPALLFSSALLTRPARPPSPAQWRRFLELRYVRLDRHDVEHHTEVAVLFLVADVHK